MDILSLREAPQWRDRAAQWFHEKWSIPLTAYQESIDACLAGPGPGPQWYLALEDGAVIGGLGVIENDFHPRRDLAPNVCAVYVEPSHRCRGVAGQLLARVCRDMAALGVPTLYLLTDHTGFYERYGWEYLCPVTGDGEDRPSRMYIHPQQRKKCLPSGAPGGTIAPIRKQEAHSYGV